MLGRTNYANRYHLEDDLALALAIRCLLLLFFQIGQDLKLPICPMSIFEESIFIVLRYITDVSSKSGL